MPVLMPSPVFRWFVPAQDGSGLVPAEGYKAKFYSAGTATPKTIYDPDGTPYPSPSNVATLNAEGYADIWLGSGGYKLVVTDPDDAEVYTLDNIFGEGNFTSGFVDTVIATDDPPTNGLAQVDTSANRFTWCAGYWQKGDGGHGFFWNETSSAPDDGGYVIASTFDTTKRWYRVPDEDGAVRAASFGYIGTIADNFVDNLLAACAYCQSYNKTLKIGAGSNAYLDYPYADLSLYAPQIVLEAGSMLTGAGSLTTIHFQGKVSGTREPHWQNADAVMELEQVSDSPEWFGASTASDNTAAFGKWFASQPNGGTFILPPGTWPYSNTTSFPYPTIPFILYGTIDATTGSDIPPGEYWPDASRVRLNQILFKDGQTLTSGSSSVGLDGDLAVDGDVSATGSLSAVGQVLATGSVISDSSIGAGAGAGGGSFYAKAGTSSSNYRMGGQLSYWYDPSGISTSGTSETDLKSYTLPANAMGTAGDRIVVRGHGVVSGSATGRSRRFRLLVGASEFQDITVAGSSFAYWEVEAIFYYIDSSTLGASVRLMTDLTGLDVGSRGPSTVQVSAHALTFTTTNVIQFKATANVSGAVTQHAMFVDYYPAP